MRPGGGLSFTVGSGSGIVVVTTDGVLDLVDDSTHDCRCDKMVKLFNSRKESIALFEEMLMVSIRRLFLFDNAAEDKTRRPEGGLICAARPR